MKLSYTELMVLSSILRSPTRTLVVTRDHSTFVDVRRLLDFINRKDIFLVTIEDIRQGHALHGIEASSVIYDETVGAMSLTDDERAEVNSRIRLPFGGTKVAVLPDGSAFATASFPLPKDHWVYAPPCEQWNAERDAAADLPMPILTHELRAPVTAAGRYAVRAATMCGTEKDFDPDAIVRNLVVALCGHFPLTVKQRGTNE